VKNWQNTISTEQKLDAVRWLEKCDQAFTWAVMLRFPILVYWHLVTAGGIKKRLCQ